VARRGGHEKQVRPALRGFDATEIDRGSVGGGRQTRTEQLPESTDIFFGDLLFKRIVSAVPRIAIELKPVVRECHFRDKKQAQEDREHKRRFYVPGGESGHGWLLSLDVSGIDAVGNIPEG
jgi:hypothetical protein